MKTQTSKIFTCFLFLQLTILICFLSCKKEDISYPLEESPLVWIVGEQTVLKSPDSGNSWINLYNTENFKVLNSDQIYKSVNFGSTLFGCIAGDYECIATTYNSEKFDGNTGYSDLKGYNSITMIDTNSFYACGNNGIIYYYSKSKSKIIYTPWAWNSNVATLNFYGIDFINISTGWVVGNNSAVYYTTNKGSTWALQNTASGNIYNDIKIHNSESNREVWIVGNKGVVFKTTDNGITWEMLNSLTTVNLTSVCFTSNNNTYITGYNGTIIKTTDGGLSFQKLTTGTTENINSISFKNNETGIAVGNNGTVLKTTNAGSSWESINLGLTKNLYSVCFAKRFIKK